ncbi:MAG TPA: radical SAM protein [Thermoplasmatales archaeon]|nr:radical SAM protein [Thermoplasmatales archaeon]
MGDVRDLLQNYFTILEENGVAKYIQCKHVPVSFDTSESTTVLWKKHDMVLQEMRVQEIEPEQSLLDLKIELATRVFKNCCFCERRCGVDRTEQAGNCKAKETLVASEFLHMGEESVLIPSYTVFFSGCTFHCVFCQNWDISQRISGVYIEPSILAGMIEKRVFQGARNVNWVGGDPTPHLLYILKVLKECTVSIPQVWNSNMYCSSEAMKLLDGVIDVYLTDFKYGNDVCAKRLSKVDNYLKVVKRNHLKAYGNGEMIIRHLVMPNHVECCSKPVIKWVAKNTPDALVNIMPQYRPEYNAYEYDDISRSVSMDEFLTVKTYAKTLFIHEI